MKAEEPFAATTPAQLPLELRDEIRDKLWFFTVFIFRLGGSVPEYTGAATCVASRGAYYLLTAAHMLKAIQKGGFAVSLDVNRLLIELPKDVVRTRLLAGHTFSEWGPDLALIHLSEVDAAEIRLHKAFYDLDRPRLDPATFPGCEHRDLWAVVGAAAEQAEVGRDDVILQLSLFDTWKVQIRHLEGFDYVDLPFDPIRRRGLPSSYGGVSGAGLWRIPIALCWETGNIAWDRSVRLAGVAFYQIPQRGQYRSIRCHGPDSLSKLLAEGSV